MEIKKSIDIEALNQQIQIDSAFLDTIRQATADTIVGQNKMIDRLLLGLLCEGHVLLEGMPGLAKTLVIKTLAKLLDGSFQRIQFTPDLLPSDIVGTMVYNPGLQTFEVKKGPIFAHFILADEINRAPAKVQSALLECMQEKQVTIGSNSYTLTQPFLVLATQNPIEQEGTYPLPEAQVDRFMLKVKVTYPDYDQEHLIIKKHLYDGFSDEINPIVTKEDIFRARKAIKNIYMDEKIEKYILDIIFASRFPSEYGLKDITPLIAYGASPRASIFLAQGARAHAFMKKRGYVIPDDVRQIATDIVSHRIGLTYEAEAEEITQEDIVDKILKTIQVP